MVFMSWQKKMWLQSAKKRIDFLQSVPAVLPFLRIDKGEFGTAGTIYLCILF